MSITTENAAIDPEGWIRAHLNFLQDLPAPDDGVWITRFQPWDASKALLLVENRVVDKVTKADVRGRSFWVYRTNPDAWAYIQQKLGERENVMPCGHSGFRNLDGELFACGYDGCGARHSRAVVEEVLDGE